MRSPESETREVPKRGIVRRLVDGPTGTIGFAAAAVVITALITNNEEAAGIAGLLTGSINIVRGASVSERERRARRNANNNDIRR